MGNQGRQEALYQMPTYAKFMKELLIKKRSFIDEKKIKLEAGCSVIIQKNLPLKSKDPRSFTIPIAIGALSVDKALLDLEASINLILLAMLKKIGNLEIKPTRMTLQLVDRSIKYMNGMVEDVFVKVDKFIFHVDFVVMDIKEDREVPLILGRPFMKTTKVIIDVDKGKLKVRTQDDESSELDRRRFTSQRFKKMAFFLNKTTIASHFVSHSQKTEDSASFPRRRFHVEPGPREKALLAKDSVLKPFKSYKKSVKLLKRIGDVLTVVVVAGCCYEIYVRAVTREEAQKQ
ncbi:hypothetical protein VNO80_19091 [Phaseolus coccineus]|uniref:Uncharacterized protein n=1 Tax=Phaseolus coccineus TaxID=3886 RepID=A0AAN9MEZ3_PHACN